MADLVVVAVGAGLLALTAVDSVVSWPASYVLVDDRHLAQVAGIALLPSWLWLIASFIMVFGRALSRRHKPPPWPVRVPLRARVGLSVAELVAPPGQA